MMVIERFYFSTVGHIKAIFLKKTLDKSIKIEGFALKMMTFFKEAFQVNRKSYPERVRSALFHAIKKTAANLDACVKVPGKDFQERENFHCKRCCYLDVQEAANSHDFIRKANGYEMWKKLRADPDWKALER